MRVPCQPVVSVLMAVHSANLSLLKLAVNSILNQTYQNLEFIIVDDKNSCIVSTYLDSLLSIDKRINLIKNKRNIGLTKSLILAESFSKGVYIARQDSDDISHSTRIESQVSRFLIDSDLVLLGTWYSVDSYGTSIKQYKPVDSNKKLSNQLFRLNPFCHSSAMFTKRSYNLVGGYSVNFITTQDLDLWFKLSKIGKIGIVKENLVTRCVHEKVLSLSLRAFTQVKNGFIIRWRECKDVKGCRFNVIRVTLYHFLVVIYSLTKNFIVRLLSQHG